MASVIGIRVFKIVKSHEKKLEEKGAMNNPENLSLMISLIVSRKLHRKGKEQLWYSEFYYSAPMQSPMFVLFVC